LAARPIRLLTIFGAGIMPSTRKISAQVPSIKRGGGGDVQRRRRNSDYSPAFFVALALGILGALGFVSLLAMAIAG
jgi:hypothetical protein